MNTIKRFSSYLLGVGLILAIPLTSMAYEVNILTGAGSESKAMDKGNYELAIERLEQRLQHGTGDGDSQLTNLCSAYVATGQYDKATPVCDRAVEAKGNFVGAAYNSRGVINALKGDFVAALVDFDRAEDKANYPRPRSDFGDKAPSNRRYASPEVNLSDSIEMAARNHGQTDRIWAAKQAEESEDLTAGVK